MKKLTFAAVALAASFAMADGIQSANIVGYYNVPLADGAKMTGSSFKLVDTDGMKLTDLKIDGYQESAQCVKNKGSCGMRGKITLTILDTDGSIKKDDNGDNQVYEWWETMDWDNGKTWNGDGCWKQSKSGVKTVITSENDVTFAIGDGLWVQVGSGYVEGKTVLCHSGEALIAARTIPLADGAKGVIPPLAKAVKLTAIRINGYQNSAQCVKNKGSCGMRGKITLTILATDGSIKKDANGDNQVYEWWETMDWDNGKTWNNDGCWKQSKSGVKTVIDDSNDVTFAMGEGLWIQVGSGYVEGETVAEFPGLDD